MAQRPQFRDVFLVLAYTVLAVWMLAITVSSLRRSQFIGRQRATVETELAQLSKLKEETDRQRAAAQNSERVILDVLSVCRRAEDIPQFDCDRIVAQLVDGDQVSFYLPPGDHRLEIKMTCTRNGNTPRIYSWNPELEGGHGYRLVLETSHKEGPFTWQLTSNDPGFSSHVETVPMGAFSHIGTSWSPKRVFSYPNAVTWNQLRNWQTTTFPLPSLQILGSTYSGRQGGVSCTVSTEVHVASSGPASVDVDLLYQIRASDLEHLLAPYEGDGRYKILPYNSNPKTPANPRSN